MPAADLVSLWNALEPSDREAFLDRLRAQAEADGVALSQVTLADSRPPEEGLRPDQLNAANDD